MRVLLVDDERRLVRALDRGLTAEGFEVRTAHDGFTGEALAERGDFDVIVLDVMMPGKNGYAVCSSLREKGVLTPILMLTAKDGELDEAKALNTGADDYLSKPFHYVVLLARLRALVRRAAATPSRGGSDTLPAWDAVREPQWLSVGDLEIFPEQRRVRKSGNQIDLTAKEFDILTYLARHAGQVVSKERLIDELWDFAAPSATNAVEVHVSALRKKMGGFEGGVRITTVRGAGYRLEVPS